MQCIQPRQLYLKNLKSMKTAALVSESGLSRDAYFTSLTAKKSRRDVKGLDAKYCASTGFILNVLHFETF